MPKRTRKNQGFTHVDVAVAMVVVSIGLVATAAAVVSGASMTRGAAQSQATVRMSAALMERIRSTPFADLVSIWNDAQLRLADFGGGDSSGTVVVHVAPVDTGSTRWTAFEVTAVCSFTGATGREETTFTTYVCDRTNSSPLSGGVSTLPADPTAPTVGDPAPPATSDPGVTPVPDVPVDPGTSTGPGNSTGPGSSTGPGNSNGQGSGHGPTQPTGGGQGSGSGQGTGGKGKGGAK